MMFRLAVAQLRAHRVFTLWTAGLMTVLVAIIAYIVVAGATQVEFSRAEAALYGWDRDSNGSTTLVVGPEADSFAADVPTATTPSVFAAALDSAHGHDAMAIAQGYLRTSPISPDDSDAVWEDEGLDAVAVRGEGAGPALIAGEAPAHAGEVVLVENVAREMDVAIGDEVTLYSLEWDPEGNPRSTAYPMTLVGLTASNRLLGYDVVIPAAYLSWDEVSTEGGVLLSRLPGADGTVTRAGFVSVHWNGYDRGLDVFRDPGWAATGASSFDVPSSATAWFGAAIALLIAMIVMSFAVGRSQASARTQWVATVRTMGARRSHIVAAATVETMLLAAVAMAAGTGVGVGMAQLQLSLERTYTGSTFGPTSIGWHWAIVPVVVGVTAVVAVVVAAVPAFWASRVAPTAALKPVSDITEAEVSRRVPVAWIAVPFVIGGALVALGVFGTAVPIKATAVLGWIILIVAGFALVVEVLRTAIPAVGRVLARSARPSLLTAGDALASRPRQAVAPATLMAVAIALLTMWSCGVADVAIQDFADADASLATYHLDREYLHSSLLGLPTVSTIIVAALALQLVAAAIIANHRAAASRESAARRAMGLSRRAEAVAAWWQQWIPQAIGVSVGFAVGLVAFFAVVTTSSSRDFGSSWSALAEATGIGAGYSGVVAIAMLALAAAVALVASRASRAATPLAALAPAG